MTQFPAHSRSRGLIHNVKTLAPLHMCCISLGEPKSVNWICIIDPCNFYHFPGIISQHWGGACIGGGRVTQFPFSPLNVFIYISHWAARVNSQYRPHFEGDYRNWWLMHMLFFWCYQLGAAANFDDLVKFGNRRQIRRSQMFIKLAFEFGCDVILMSHPITRSLGSKLRQTSIFATKYSFFTNQTDAVW